jgi:hypothetical protein
MEHINLLLTIMDTDHLIRFRKRLRKHDLSPLLVEIFTQEIKRRDAAGIDHYSDLAWKSSQTSD